jgi:hypothetical protein
MGRKAKPGIEYYHMDCDHTMDKKVRLLVLEQGGDGYWVWCCLLDAIYKNHGYYFNTRDKEELLLFAADHCKRPLEQVQRVIDTCLTWHLFNQDVYQRTGCLTSHRIQETYIYATLDRRKKGTRVTILQELFSVTREYFDSSREQSIHMIVDEHGNPYKSNPPGPQRFLPGNNPLLPGPNTQSRVDIEKNRDIDKSISPKTGVLDGVGKDNSTDGVTDEIVADDAPPPIQKPIGLTVGVVKATERKKVTAPKKKEDTGVYMKEMTAVFRQFVKLNFAGAEYEFTKVDGVALAELMKVLKRRAGDQQKSWDLGQATLSFNNFLTEINRDDFVHRTFQLPVINQFKNKVFLKTTNQNVYGQSSTHRGPARRTQPAIQPEFVDHTSQNWGRRK